MNKQGRPDPSTRHERWQNRAVVSVTDHRLLSREERVADGVDQTLQQVELAHRARPLTVLSPLARGADQLVVCRALRHL